MTAVGGRLEVVAVRSWHVDSWRTSSLVRYDVACPLHGTYGFPPECFAAATLCAHDHFGHLPIPPAPRPKSRRRRIVVTL